MIDQPRHDKIQAAADAARRDFDELMRAAHESIRTADHVRLIGNWLDDVRVMLLPQAKNASSERDEVMWLETAELFLRWTTGMLASLQADIARFGGPANARLIGG